MDFGGRSLSHAIAYAHDPSHVLFVVLFPSTRWLAPTYRQKRERTQPSVHLSTMLFLLKSGTLQCSHRYLYFSQLVRVLSLEQVPAGARPREKVRIHRSIIRCQFATRTTPPMISYVESHGDYLQDNDTAHQLYTENPNVPLFRNQETLPRLPLPSVQDSLRKLMPTALPLVENEQEAKRFQRACQNFPKQAQKLQERLARRQAHKNNSS